MLASRISIQNRSPRPAGRSRIRPGAVALACGLAASLASRAVADTYIEGNQTWSTGPVVLTDNLVIKGTLTVHPGVVVRIAEGFHIRVDAGGTLLVNGTKAAPVLFTAQPDQHWNGLKFEKDSAGRLSHAVLESINNTGLAIDGASPRIEWTTIRSVTGSASGFSAYAIDVTGNATPVITGCTIDGVFGATGAVASGGSSGGPGGTGTSGTPAAPGGDGSSGNNGPQGPDGGQAYGVRVVGAGLPGFTSNRISNVRGGTGGRGGAGGNAGTGGGGGQGLFAVFSGDGGNGGWGGHGGNGGQGGLGGTAFGVYLEKPAANALVVQNLIFSIEGGTGGAGSNGGTGGAAGRGGNGSNSGIPFATAGKGGNGGTGGNGGDGGNGGTGGNANGIRVFNAAQPVLIRQNTIATIQRGFPGGSYNSGALGGAPGGGGTGGSNVLGYSGSNGSAGTEGPIGDPGALGTLGATFGLRAIGATGASPVQIDARNNIVTLDGTDTATAVRGTSNGVVLSDFNLFHGYATLISGTVVIGDNDKMLDPKFVSPGGGDFRVLAASPAIDAGDNFSVAEDLDFDLAGLPRMIDVPTVPNAGPTTTVDIGAYEFGQLFGTASGDRIRGSVNVRGTRTVAYTSADSRPMLLQKENDSRPWYISALDDAVQLHSQTGDVLTWTDTDTDNPYVAILTESATHAINTAGTDGFDTDLTARIPGATAIVSSPAVFTSTDGKTHLAGIDAAEDLVMYFQTGQAAPNDWAYTNLSRDHLRPQGIETPAFGGELVGFVTAWNGMNIAGLDKSGQIQAVWWAPGMARWRADNISTLTGAPTLVGSLTPFITPWGGITLTGTDEHGSLSTTWWVTGNPWITSNLTELVDGPALLADSLSSFVTPWGGLNVAGTAPDGSVQIYWWAPGLSEWAVSPISDLIPGADLPAGKMTGVAAPTGEINLLGSNVQGEVFRYHWHPGVDWAAENISRIADRK